MIQDGHGQKMSKSLGNGVDPRDIIHSHGADAMRYTLVQMTTDTQDVRMPVDLVCPHSGQAFTPEFMTTAGRPRRDGARCRSRPSTRPRRWSPPTASPPARSTPTAERPLARNTSAKFDLGRNFANKVWNATRFALRRLDGAAGTDQIVVAGDARFVDRWILARLHETVATLERALHHYQFNVYADTLYDFVWRDVCDRYLEAVKPTIDDDPTQQVVLGAVLDAVLRIMHPVCPFVTEALWPAVSAARCGHIDGLDLPRRSPARRGGMAGRGRPARRPRRGRDLRPRRHPRGDDPDPACRTQRGAAQGRHGARARRGAGADRRVRRRRRDAGRHRCRARRRGRRARRLRAPWPSRAPRCWCRDWSTSSTPTPNGRV